MKFNKPYQWGDYTITIQVDAPVLSPNNPDWNGSDEVTLSVARGGEVLALEFGNLYGLYDHGLTAYLSNFLNDLSGNSEAMHRNALAWRALEAIKQMEQNNG